MPELLTISEACQKLEISERTFRRMVSAGEFPQPVRRNRRWVRVPRTDIQEYLNKLVSRREVWVKG
jgi:excisionase family DNA binding protein